MQIKYKAILPSGKLYTNCTLALQVELISRETRQQVAFSHARITNQYDYDNNQIVHCTDWHSASLYTHLLDNYYRQKLLGIDNILLLAMLTALCK